MTCSSLQPSLRHLLLQVLVAAVCVPPLLRPPLAFTGDPFVRPFRCCHNLFHHIHPSILTCMSSDIFCLALCLLCARAHIHMHTHTHSHSMSSQARSAALDPRGSLLTSDLGLENAPFRDHPNTWKRSQAVWVVCVCVSSSVSMFPCACVKVAGLFGVQVVGDACIGVRVYECINKNTCPLAVRCIATRCLHGHSCAPPTHPPCSHPCLLFPPHPPPAPNPCSFFSLTQERFQLPLRFKMPDSQIVSVEQFPSSSVYKQLNSRRYTATCCNTLHHTAPTATHCGALQLTATHATQPAQLLLQRYICNTLQRTPIPGPRCHTLQHVATCCNMLQHTTTLCTTLHHAALHGNTLHHTATHYNTLHYTQRHSRT